MKKTMGCFVLTLCAACFAADLQPMKWAEGSLSAGGPWTQGADGVLTASKDEAIWSAADYENFTLDFEYKLDPAANSGVILYCSDVKNWIPNSFEIQLLDDDSPKWKKDGAYVKNSSIYGRLAPLCTPAKPAGEWNHMVVTAKGRQIVVMLNGEKTIETDLSLWTNAKKNLDGSPVPPWLGRPLASLATKGRIGFQGLHGGARPYFRNVKIGPAK